MIIKGLGTQYNTWVKCLDGFRTSRLQLLYSTATQTFKKLFPIVMAKSSDEMTLNKAPNALIYKDKQISEGKVFTEMCNDKK